MDKRRIYDQIYEEYWKLTLEYSDFTGEPFNEVLRTIVEFIDERIDAEIGFTTELYGQLQAKIGEKYKKKDSASTRKSINQFFKLGFINDYGKSYHALTKKFLFEQDKETKKLIYSQIVYANAAFSRSVTNPSQTNEIKFLIKTLEHCKRLDKNELFALIYTDVTKEEKGYATAEELQERYRALVANGATERKYNQCNYLFNLCKSLTDIHVCDYVVSIDAEVEEAKAEKPKCRDPYLQMLYKRELVKEYQKTYHTAVGKCMLEHLAYPILIASHIKPYKVCTAVEEFDNENGLLLSKNMDYLFDQGYITFDEDGNVIASVQLETDVAAYVKSFCLDSIVYTSKRKAYMEYHRTYVFRKSFVSTKKSK